MGSRVRTASGEEVEVDERYSSTRKYLMGAPAYEDKPALAPEAHREFTKSDGSGRVSFNPAHVESVSELKDDK